MVRWTLLAVTALLSCIAATGCATPGAHNSSPGNSGDTKPSLLVNLAHGKSNLHAASMALGVAKSALDQGSRVVLFLNVEAAALADRNLGPDVRFADFPPVSELLRDIIAKHGEVMVCSHCAAIMNLKRENMLTGVTVSEQGEFLKALRPGMIGLSY